MPRLDVLDVEFGTPDEAVPVLKAPLVLSAAMPCG